LADLKERVHWNDYQQVYEEAIEATSKDQAPWFIVPVDDKWFTTLVIAGIIYKQFEKLKLHFPRLMNFKKEELRKSET